MALDVRHHVQHGLAVLTGHLVAGEVTLGRELHPLADAVLSAVREADLRLVLTEDSGGPELAKLASPPECVPASAEAGPIAGAPVVRRARSSVSTRGRSSGWVSLTFSGAPGKTATG